MDIPNARAFFKVVDGKNVIDKINGRPMTDPDLTNRFLLGSNGAIEELGEPDGFFHNQQGTNLLEIPFTSGAFLDNNGKPLSVPPFDWGFRNDSGPERGRAAGPVRVQRF